MLSERIAKMGEGAQKAQAYRLELLPSPTVPQAPALLLLLAAPA